MKTMFDPSVRDELQQRIRALRSESRARWGKMSLYQMIRHCTIWSDWVLGKDRYSNHLYTQDLLGKLFGKWALKSNTKSDKPMSKGMPAGKAFLVKEKEGDMEAAKALWIQQVAGYQHFDNKRFVHDFFGRMSEEQIGIFSYKHFDHHLRQFGV